MRGALWLHSAKALSHLDGPSNCHLHNSWQIYKYQKSIGAFCRLILRSPRRLLWLSVILPAHLPSGTVPALLLLPLSAGRFPRVFPLVRGRVTGDVGLQVLGTTTAKPPVRAPGCIPMGRGVGQENKTCTCTANPREKCAWER